TATATTSDNGQSRSGKDWTVRHSPISTDIPVKPAMTAFPTASSPITWPITTPITEIPVGGTTLRASASMSMTTAGLGEASTVLEGCTAGAIPIGAMAGTLTTTVDGAGTIPGGTTDGAGEAIMDPGAGDTPITVGVMPDIT